MRLRRSIKCILSLATALFLSIGLAPPSVSVADGTGSLQDVVVTATTQSGAFSEGDKVTVDIAITQNPGIRDLSLSIGFNTNALMFESASLSGTPFSSKEVDYVENGDVIAFSVSSSQLPDFEGTIVSLKFEAYRSESVAPVTVSVNSYASLEDVEEDSGDDEVVEEDDSDSEVTDSKSQKDKDTSGNTGKTGKSGTKKTVRPRKVAGKADKSYKTGDSLGSNAFLIVGLVAAALAAIILIIDKKMTKSVQQ